MVEAPQPVKPLSPARVPTGNPGSRDNGPRPQTGNKPVTKE